MESYTDDILLWTTSKVLEELSVCSCNKRGIAEAGGIQVLAKHLSHQNKHLVFNCLRILRKVSYLATEQVDLDPLIQDLLELLLHGDVNVVPCAAHILSNMQCNSYRNEVAVRQAGSMGLEAFARARGSCTTYSQPS